MRLNPCQPNDFFAEVFCKVFACHWFLQDFNQKSQRCCLLFKTSPIGGDPQEAEAAEYIRAHISKPVVAYVAGLTAPKGRTMGHAGAIISAFGESASEKVEILSAAGVTVAEHPSIIGETIAGALSDKH